MSVERQRFATYLVKECNLAPSTAFAYEQCLRRIERFTSKNVRDVTVEEMRVFLQSDYHPATKNATLVALKSFHKWGALEGLWGLDGLMALRAPKQIRQPQPSLSTPEARHLLSICRRPNEFRAIYLPLFGGTRVSEAAGIGPNEWIQDSHVRKLAFVGKGRKFREVPIHPRLADVREVILQSQTSVDALKHTIRSLAHWSGIKFTAHTLRRTFAVHLSEAGANRDVIGHLLGHAPASVTEMAYVPIRWEEMVQAMGRLAY